jgi:hypothetical protein
MPSIDEPPQVAPTACRLEGASRPTYTHSNECRVYVIQTSSNELPKENHHKLTPNHNFSSENHRSHHTTPHHSSTHTKSNKVSPLNTMENAPLLVHGNAAAAPTLTEASTAPDVSPSPAPRTSRRRGHRAQSAVWRFLTTDENPHHAISTECMHCRHQVPHHRKNEKARAHLRRCAAFRDKMSELPPEERPAWVDLTARVRGASSQYATRRASTQAPTHSTRASSPSLSVAMDVNNLGTVVSDVDMLDESLIAPIQTPAAAHGKGGSGQDGHDDQAEQEQREPSDRQLGGQEVLDVDQNDERGDTTAFHSSMGIQSVQDAVAIHVYMTGIPIESVAEANLATAFRLANSAVALPTLEEMRGLLLNRAYQRVRAKVDADMQLSEYNALSSSGWWSGDNRCDSEHSESASTTKHSVKYMAVNEVQTFFMGASRVSEAEWQNPKFLSSEIARLMEHSPRRISGTSLVIAGIH